MLEAHIVSPRGSLYYAGEAHPYDLEMLWEHVQDAGADLGGDVQLELTIHAAGIEAPVRQWIRRLDRHGVRMRLLFARTPGCETSADHVAVG